jgi:hypothetical protein
MFFSCVMPKWSASGEPIGPPVREWAYCRQEEPTDGPTAITGRPRDDTRAA